MKKHNSNPGTIALVTGRKAASLRPGRVPAGRSAGGRCLAALIAFVALAIPASAAASLPFWGIADLTITEVVPLGKDSVQLTASATGVATHLGRYTRTETVVLTPSTGVLVGTVVFTAANGDELHADVAGGFTSPTTAEGTYSFTGGTGRFKTASGEASFEAVTTDGVHFAITFEGTLDD